MKIIFLDIDGVLNFKDCDAIFDGYYFASDNKLKLLKEIIDQTGANIVLSSDWKIGWIHKNGGKNSPQYKRFVALEEKMREFGISLFSKTPTCDSGYRGDEIKLWLQNWNEEVTDFFILDDMDDVKPFVNKLVRTSFLKGGLQREHVEKAVKILNGEKYD